MKTVALLGRSSSMERFATLANILNYDYKDIKAIPVEYTDITVEQVQKNLTENFQYVICWIDPVSFNNNGEEETRAHSNLGNYCGLDQMLRQIAKCGVKVSTHPDIIEKMGTKRVLFDTRNQAWGLPTTKFYKTKDDLYKNLRHSLASDKCRVLKMERGSSGRGVWRCDVIKGEDANNSSDTTVDIMLRVQHAGDDTVETGVPLETLLHRLEERMKTTGGGVVDMPFLPAVDQGIIRCYMFRNRCGGILHQLPLSHSDMPTNSVHYPNLNVSKSKKYRTNGLPEGKCVHPPNSPEYQDIVETIEKDWIPNLIQTVGLSAGNESSIKSALPVVWDIDFIHRSPDASECSTKGVDSLIRSNYIEYVLCEINVSCVFPGELMKEMAKEIFDWMTEEIK